MILKNLNIIGNGDKKKSIIIRNTKIQKICNENEIIKPDNKTVTFKNAIAFPGLINSHDHLEFNLFPSLGNKTYKNYVEWGEDIHNVNKKQIESVLKIPFHLRYKWGIYRNLFSGVTTAFQHGRILQDLKENIIDVYTGGKVIHSVKLDKYWRLRINFPDFKPIVIHIGEGSDETSRDEINTLMKWNFLNKKTVGIHGIALTKENAKYLKAVIWCPVSNYFLFNKTASINEFKKETEILFGTDSTVSAQGNIWDHLRFARGLKLLDDEELFNSLTSTPAKVWNLKYSGKIRINYKADLVVAEQKLNGIWDSFYATNSEDILLILKRGKMVFGDESIINQLKLPEAEMKQFTKVFLSGRIKHIWGNLKGLVDSIRKYNPEIQFPFQI